MYIESTVEYSFGPTMRPIIDLLSSAQDGKQLGRIVAALTVAGPSVADYCGAALFVSTWIYILRKLV